MKEKIKRALCLALCIATAVSASACELLLGELPSPNLNSSTVSEKEPFDGSSDLENSEESSNKQENDSNDPENSSDNTENSSDNTEDSSSSNEDSSDNSDNTDPAPDDSSSGVEDEESELPPVADPDPEKELLKRETDSLGHEIAYYSDGTWEDLGRVTPLDFTPQAVTERFGYQSFTKETKADDLCAFYTDLYDASVAFLASKADIAMDEHNYHAIAQIDYAVYELTFDELVSVWRVFKQDCPEFYWLGNAVYTLGDDFCLCIDEIYASGAVREATQDAIEAAALVCDTYINGKMSDVERALTIHDYLATEITYAYEADGVTPSNEVWAHNIVGWAEYGTGVCETYAESFAYLCNLFDLESAVVVGVAAEEGVMGGHAWNILQLDGEWYTVDVTWDDGYEWSYDDLIGREWFGKAASEFAWTHVADSPANGWGNAYQFDMPTLSDSGLSPVLLSKNGGEAVMVASVDKAFEKMTNEGSRYEITLYPATKIQTAKNVKVYPEGAKVTKEMPKVAELTFTGGFVVMDEENRLGFIPQLLCEKTFTLGGDLVLDGLTFYTVGLNENGYQLTKKNNAETQLVQIVQ